ncbi:hypothetical protein OJJOAM_003614 [Cupriavidus sp. H18C1]
MVSTTPPSTRNAAPVVADACGEQTYTTMCATSSTVAARWRIELGRCALTNWAAASSIDSPALSASSRSISRRPSDSVGPGNTALTVTPVPLSRLARPRDTASCAVFEKP